MENIVISSALYGTTTQFDNMEWSQQNFGQQNPGSSYANSGAMFSTQAPDIGYQSASNQRSPTVHKPSHQSFLNWVAFERNLTPGIHEIDKRTCPLARCEQLFDHPDIMLAHLKTCPWLSKGVYRCLETSKVVRVGKCTCQGCQQLHQHCKDRIATAVSSLKRRLSPRGSRPDRLIDNVVEKQTMSPEMSVVDQMRDETYPVGVAELAFDVRPPLAELGTDCEIDPIRSYHELDAGKSCGYADSYDSDTSPQELGSFNYGSFDYDAAPPYEPGLFGTEKSEGNAYHSSKEPIVPELEAPSSSTQQFGGSCGPHEMSGTSATYQIGDEEDRSCDYYISPVETQGNAEDWTAQTESDIDDHYFQRNGLIDEAIFAANNKAPEQPIWQPSSPSIYSHYTPSTRANSGSDSDSAETVFSNAPTLSSSKATMSSFDTLDGSYSLKHIDATPESSPETAIRILDEDTVMIDEPDSDLSIFDTLNQPYSMTDNFKPGPHHRPTLSSYPSKHRRIPRKAVTIYEPNPTSSNFARPLPLAPDIDYRRHIPKAVTPPTPKRQSQNIYTCSYCPREFKDKSNMRRHQNTSCKLNVDKGSEKTIFCRFPDCDASFTRTDNLAVHLTKSKKHERR